MIVIPKKLKKRKHKLSKEFYHYDLLEDKCTKTLAVYRCQETGHIETWQKRDFIVKENKTEYKTKYE